jgi:hypothetical protein
MKFHLDGPHTPQRPPMGYRFPYLLLLPTCVVAFLLGILVGKYWF